MSELGELYQGVILDHNRNPRNFRPLPDATAHAAGNNPLCGDELTVWVRLDSDGRIVDASFVGEGCAISKASASLMTQAVKGRSRAEALDLFERFHQLVTGTLPANTPRDALGKLTVFGGVSEFPIRVKCASLAWHTMKAALEDSNTNSEHSNHGL
jgi:nitrogen fixation protein NifU and related proteins